MLKVLFLCSQNRMRSPTAEAVFRDHPDLDVRSAGTDPDARTAVSRDLIEWADLVFVMETRHRNVLRRKFKTVCDGRRIICLHIPDEYGFMDPHLVELLDAAVRPVLERTLAGRRPK